MKTNKIAAVIAALVIALGPLSAQAGGRGWGGNDWRGNDRGGSGYGGGCQNCGNYGGGPVNPPNGPSGGGYGGGSGHGGGGGRDYGRPPRYDDRWGGGNDHYRPRHHGGYDRDRPRGNWETNSGYYHEYSPGRYRPVYDPWAPRQEHYGGWYW